MEKHRKVSTEVEKWPWSVLILQLLDACCSNFMEISLHSSLRWARCWGFRLSFFLKWQLCILWSWQKSKLNLSSGGNFWMLSFRCWGPLPGLAGDGTGSAKSMYVYSQVSSGTRCTGMLPIGKLHSPSPLCVVSFHLWPTPAACSWGGALVAAGSLGILSF